MAECVLDRVGSFVWLWGHDFFIETATGNFIWSDPGYPGGDNTLRATTFTLSEWLKKLAIPYGRDKGRHIIRAYCGPDVRLV
jgi:hypothetical protein